MFTNFHLHVHQREHCVQVGQACNRPVVILPVCVGEPLKDGKLRAVAKGGLEALAAPEVDTGFVLESSNLCDHPEQAFHNVRRQDIFSLKENRGQPCL